ncbi:MAG: ABC transporter substrate-binding protein [Bacillota bacterium]|nr:ABC transporter substrate-binding protein [Bacillota bacterium]
MIPVARRRLRPAALLLALGLVLGACGGQAGGTPAAPQGKAGSTAQKQLRTVTLLLDWYPNVDHAWLYAAMDLGYFRRQGLQVKVEVPSQTTDPLKLVGSGRVDLGIGYPKDVLLARSQGIPVVSVAAVVQHPLNTVIALRSSGIRTLEDLRGKSIGTAGTPSDQAILETLAEKLGVPAGRIRSVNVGFDLIPALTTHRVDAIEGGYTTVEALQLPRQGYPVTVFPVRELGVPDYYELVLITNETTLERDRAVLDAFWKAAQEGEAWVAAHPDQAVDILARHASGLDRGLALAGLKVLLPQLRDPGQPYGQQTEAKWATLENWMLRHHLLEKPVDASGIFVDVADEVAPKSR